VLPRGGQLETAVKQTGETLKAFNKAVLTEWERFQQQKNDDLRAILKDFAHAHSQFFVQVRSMLPQAWHRLWEKADIACLAGSAPCCVQTTTQLQQEWEKLLPTLENMQV